MSKLMKELLMIRESLKEKKDESSKQKLEEINHFIISLKYLIKSEIRLSDIDFDEFYKQKEFVAKSDDFEFITFMDSYFMRIEFLRTYALKYATSEEINECIDEEIELSKEKILKRK